MKVIKARSPFSAIINVAGQIETKVELFLWNKPDSIPATPNYTFSSKIVSVANPIGVYNLANEIQEFLNAIMPTTNGVKNEQDSRAMWCNVQVKTYYKTATTFVLSQTLNYVAVNAYRNYQDGLQNTNTVTADVPYFLCGEVSIEQNLPIGTYDANYKYPFVDLLVDKTLLTGDILVTNGEAIENYNLTTGTGIDMYRIPVLTVGTALANSYVFRVFNGGDKIVQKTINLICEVKYTPLLLSFIGKNGGWEHIYCFKAKEESIEIKDLEFKSNQNYFTFDPNIGQRQTYNLNGKKSIKVNTGFVEETTNTLVDQLYLSETVTLDGLPVLLKGKATVLKQAIKEKNINYTFEFDYNFNLINDFI
jgi:hypothetical protein